MFMHEISIFLKNASPTKDFIKIHRVWTISTNERIVLWPRSSAIMRAYQSASLSNLVIMQYETQLYQSGAVIPLGRE